MEPANGEDSITGDRRRSPSPPPPPPYPCEEECSRCGGRGGRASEEEETPCLCECHRRRGPDDDVPPPASIAGCPPGCGASGLPCYGCSLLQAHLRPKKTFLPLPPPAAGSVPAFTPRIYTIELVERPALSSSSPGGGRRSPEDERNGKNVGISVVFFAVFLIVFVAMFKILFLRAGGSFW